MEPITLRAARQRRDWTLEELSLAAGRSYPLLSRIERGLAPLTPGMAASLAAVLGVSADALIAGQSELRERIRATLVGIGEPVELAR
jgi:transcriptional regulator with XRE-family HTH domain